MKLCYPTYLYRDLTYTKVALRFLWLSFLLRIAPINALARIWEK